ncbi:MAG: LPP20 family lipoprotein [Treponema sp.]|nr:LPP20 family lipoprotein [Treponema sp.]
MSAGIYPVWVTKPGTLYPDSQYVAAAGDGKTAEDSQYKARANLLGIFGIRLADESIIAEMFQQSTVGGRTNWNETVSSDRRITASAEGILAGCEITEMWQNDRGTEYYALAVMNKARTIDIYNDIIARLSQDIREALNLPNLNSIDGYRRYKFAAVLAKDIDSCINVLRYVGGSGSVPAGLKSENEYLIEANNIVRAIPVRVALVRGSQFDKEERIQKAFARALGSVGFRTGDNNSPYTLEVTLSLSEVNLSQQYKFARYEITANFIQMSTRQGVFPAYSINDREGHANYPEAEQRAIRKAEARINEEYKNELEKNLSQFN